MTNSIIDISEWKFVNKNVSGSKEKRWYRSILNNQLALFKLPISSKKKQVGKRGQKKFVVESGKLLDSKPIRLISLP
ncbi:hypothetical protein [Neobacillus sp. Marseille-QA0830]